MPLYVYLCQSCETRFERLRTFAERLEPAECPECQAEARFTLSMTTPAFIGAGDDCGEAGRPVGPGGCGAGCTCVSN
jgi:putative FmdB family regulatory protein